jgi:hypothetical protein
MAETTRMTAEQVVSYLFEEDGLDFLRESLTWVVQQLMEAEPSELVGAARGERAPEERLTHRNGYRARTWATRAGEIELAIPKLRRGSYFPSFLEPRRRSEQALVSVVQQAYVAGVSTRKVDQMVESLALRISKSEVSRIARAWTSRSRRSGIGRSRAAPRAGGEDHGLAESELIDAGAKVHGTCARADTTHDERVAFLQIEPKDARHVRSLS